MKQCAGVLLLLLSLEVMAQVQWIGAGGNGLWSDPLNWDTGILPGATDDVVIDNSLVPGSFLVQLPDASVAVRSLSLRADQGNTITLLLPSSNLITATAGSLAPRALSTNGPGYSINIGAGGIFINASGSSSGYSVFVSDSFRIATGGKYIHRTRTAHAELVQKLSRAPDTNHGIFRFENTDAASTISLSNRVFGSLELSSEGTSNDTTSYSSSGTSPVLIRGNLHIGKGVSLALHFSDTIQVEGDLILEHCSFNMSSSIRSLVVNLKGNWMQQNARMYESNSSSHSGTLLLSGNATQLLRATGSITDSIRLVIQTDNTVIIESLPPLPYQLDLRKGVVRLEEGNRMELNSTAFITADSLLANTFIEGEIKKNGLLNQDFFFPVGSAGQQRWMRCMNATGDIAVRHVRADPYQLHPMVGDGLDHISQMEYWSVQTSPATTGSIELSFENNFSGGVSDLSSLRVAGNKGFGWTDLGNMATTGNAFLSGSVITAPLDLTEVQYLTLGSALSGANTLPVLIQKQWMVYGGGRWSILWETAGQDERGSFDVELSADGIHFNSVESIPGATNQYEYRSDLPPQWQKGFCRLRISGAEGIPRYGAVLRFGQEHIPLVRLGQSGQGVWLQTNSNDRMRLSVEFINLSGQRVRQDIINVLPTPMLFRLDTGSLRPGLYIVRISSGGQALLVTKLLL